MLQSALHGAERLSDACWIWSAINLVVIGELAVPVFACHGMGLMTYTNSDDIAYVWYYDNERAIQSAGINFVTDLPYFLVLLLAFQRFTLEDWGVNVELRDAAIGDKPFLFPKSDVGELKDAAIGDKPLSFLKSDVSVKLDPDQRLREHFGLLGRASQVLVATSESPDPRDPKFSLKGKELVAKVYHPEITRENEAEMIQLAHESGKGDPEVEGHLPDVICAVDFPAFSTDKIRRALGIYDRRKEERARIPRIIIFVRYYPITDLVGEEFWKCFWECFRCEYHLRSGIESGG